MNRIDQPVVISPTKPKPLKGNVIVSLLLFISYYYPTILCIKVGKQLYIVLNAQTPQMTCEALPV